MYEILTNLLPELSDSKAVGEWIADHKNDGTKEQDCSSNSLWWHRSFSNLRVVEHFCILFLFRRYHLQIVLYMKLSVLKSTFSYIHCLCLLKFSPLPASQATGLLWLLLTSRHSLLLTHFILCFHPLTRSPRVPHITFSPYICHIYYN